MSSEQLKKYFKTILQLECECRTMQETMATIKAKSQRLGIKTKFNFPPKGKLNRSFEDSEIAWGFVIAVGSIIVGHIIGAILGVFSDTFEIVVIVKAGYADILLKPQFIQGLTQVQATRETPYGTLACSWKCKGGEITVDVVIPANTTATLYLPEQGKPVLLGSGTYHHAYPTCTCLEPQKYSLDTTIVELSLNPLAVQLLEQAMPGAGQMIGMEFLQKKTIRELLVMSPPGSEMIYQNIIQKLNEKAS